MIDMFDIGSKKFDWWLDWRGECVAIVAAGPSAKRADLSKLRDRIHVIVVNESYRLCSWADILYSCDAEWWNLRRNDVKEFRGLKLTNGPRNDQWDGMNPTKLGIPDLKMIHISKKNAIWVNDFLFDEPGEIGSGGNSGFQTINLSGQFGATGIGLIGFDMHTNSGVHWHGEHPIPLRNPDRSRMYQWRQDLEKRAFKLKKYDIDVVNCCADSTLQCFPKMTIDQMLERWGL